MKWSRSSVAIVVAAVWSVALGAQSGGTMASNDKMEMTDAKYTGCVEAGNTAGTFTLTHVMSADHMGKDMMKNDAMTKSTMAREGMAKNGMSHESMAPAVLTLTGSSVDLSKHVGHKVSISGSPGHDRTDAMQQDVMGKPTSAFTVKSLKMIAATCS